MPYVPRVGYLFYQRNANINNNANAELKVSKLWMPLLLKRNQTVEEGVFLRAGRLHSLAYESNQGELGVVHERKFLETMHQDLLHLLRPIFRAIFLLRQF